MDGRRARRIFSVLSPALFFFGCDMLTQAYQEGFGCGYFAVDATYNCAAGCEEQRQQRAAEQAVWSDACFLPPADHFDDQAALDAANRQCDDRTFGAGIVLCDDVGQVLDSEPPGCRPFRPPLLGVPVEESYRCPSSVRGDGLLCLCCDDAAGSSCALTGGFCRDDAACCSGRCAIEEVDAGTVNELVDGGLGDAGPIFVPAPRGTCE